MRLHLLSTFMLVFIDESGDTGLKVDQGSSRYFTIALVLFDDNEEAVACDQRITLLRKELGWVPDREFHFKHNSDAIRRAFLTAVAPYNFFYHGVVLNKDPQKLWGSGFKDKLADYVAGVINRSVQKKRKYPDDYRDIISHREMRVQIWPK